MNHPETFSGIDSSVNDLGQTPERDTPHRGISMPVPASLRNIMMAAGLSISPLLASCNGGEDQIPTGFNVTINAGGKWYGAAKGADVGYPPLNTMTPAMIESIATGGTPFQIFVDANGDGEAQSFICTFPEPPVQGGPRQYVKGENCEPEGMYSLKESAKTAAEWLAAILAAAAAAGGGILYLAHRPKLSGYIVDTSNPNARTRALTGRSCAVDGYQFKASKNGVIHNGKILVHKQEIAGNLYFFSGRPSEEEVQRLYENNP